MPINKQPPQDTVETMSALMDGELRFCPQTIIRVSACQGEVWERYHLIREVIVCPDSQPSLLDSLKYILTNKVSHKKIKQSLI